MSNIPHQHAQRAARVRPAEYTPAVLRIEDGSCTQATLELYSLTGGLLSLPRPLNRGARARVLFLTHGGPVLGVAEMLMPVSWTEQPFRFVGLNADDEHRLRTATQPAAEPEPATLAHSTPLAELIPTFDGEAPWIGKYRAALDGSVLPAKRFRRVFLATLTATLGLGLLLFVFQALLLR